MRGWGLEMGSRETREETGKGLDLRWKLDDDIGLLLS